MVNELTWLDAHLHQVFAAAAFLVSLVCLVIVAWPTKPQPVLRTRERR